MTAIDAALAEAGVEATVVTRRPLSGGCIHDVQRLELSDGRVLVAKIAGRADRAMLEEERAGLETLAATATVHVPTPLAVAGDAAGVVLLMTEMPAGHATDEAWTAFGRELAALHAVDVGPRYGFKTDNHLGRTPQPNGWCDEWVTFNREHRLGHQVSLAESRGLFRGDEASRLRHVVDRLDEVLPATPRRSLLHGDLWSGNALASVDADGCNRIAVIDPAPSIGDGWADIAMMQLFGGFPASVYAEYGRAVDDHDGVERRIAAYQLYHVLNHLNLFGRGYATQAMSLAGRLG
jgi:fructosamine-3-kinase